MEQRGMPSGSRKSRTNSNRPSFRSQRGFEIELVGEIAAMMRLGLSGDAGARRTLSSGGGDPDLFLRSVKVVAGAHNHLDLLLVG